MKNVYEVTIASTRETATRSYMVQRPNVIDAARAGLSLYRKGEDWLYGRARVSKVEEIGTIDE